MRIILLSDLHIKPESTVENLGWVKHFCDFMKCRYSPETLVFVLGDIVDKGSRYGQEAFNAADQIFSYIASELETVKFQIAFIPGNHDYCNGSLDAFSDFCRRHQKLSEAEIDFREKSVWNYVRGNYNFILVDSIQSGDYSKPGSLDLECMGACVQNNKINIIFMHHSLIFEDRGEHTGVVNQPQVVEFMNKKHIQFVFHGHAHAMHTFPIDEAGLKLFGVGSLGLDKEDLQDLPNEYEQFLELKLNSRGVESIANWLWRGGERRYFSSMLFPDVSSKYESGGLDLRKVYEKPTDYIERQVMLREFAAEDAVTRALLYDNKKTSLYEACETDQYVLLIADAGLGKTIEMENLAYMASARNPYPILLPLNSYESGPIDAYIEIFAPEYKTQDPNSFFLIFDGFDELAHPDAFKRALRQFVTSFPEAKICISMRSNFLPFNSNSNVFDNYKKYQLLELETPMIEEVLQRNSIEASGFLAQCTEKNLVQFVRTPFYLNALIKIFDVNKALPSQVELMDQLVEIHFTEDAKKFETTLKIPLEERQREFMQALVKLACGLQLLNIPVLDEKTFQTVLEEKDRDYIKYSSLAIRTNGGHCFSHNNFKEFFVAKWLASKSTDDILRYIAVPKTQMLNPSWFNVLGFILLLNPRDDLVDWMMKAEPLLLTRIEKDRVDENLRYAVLDSTLSDIVDRNVWFSHATCTEKDLAAFSQSRQALDLLLNQIQTPKHFRAMYFSLRVLFHFSELYGEEERVRQLLAYCAQSDTVRPHEKRVAIPAIAALHLDTDEITKDLVTRYRESDSSYVRHGIYEYLLEIGKTNEYVDYLLEGIKYISYSYSKTEETNGTENFALINCLCTINQPQAVQEVIHWLCRKQNMNLDFYDRGKVFGTIFEAAAHLYEEGNTYLFEVVYDFLIHAERGYSRGFAQLGWDFFVATHTYETAFEKLVNEDWNFLLLFVSDILEKQPELLDLLCSLYMQDKLQNPKLLNDYALHVHRNEKIFTKCAETILEKTGETLQYPERPDYEGKRKADIQMFFNSLFEKEKLKDLLGQLAEFYKQPEITLNELQETRDWSDSYPPGTQELEFSLIRCGPNDVRVIDFLDWVNWENFFVAEICDLVQNEKALSLLEISPEQQKVLLETYHKLEMSIDYHSAIKEESDNNFRCSQALYWYMILQEVLKLPAPDTYYLGLLEIPHTFIRGIKDADEKYERIEQHIPITKIKRQIEILAVDETRCSVLSDLFNGLRRYKSKSGKDVAVEMCCKNELSAWQRREALLYLLEVFGTDYLFTELISIIDESLFEEAVNQLQNNNSERITEELLRRFKTSPNDFLIKHLIFRNIPDGLQAYIDILRRTGRIENQYGDDGEIIQAVEVIHDVNLLPLLADAVRLRFSDGFVDGEFHSLTGALRSAFSACAKNDYELVNSTLETLKAELDTNQDAISYCNMLQDEIKETYKLSFIPDFSCKEVRHILYTDVDI